MNRGAMNDKQNPNRTLKPRLRFPEFAEREKWELKELEQVCNINPSSTELPDTFFYIDLESVDSGELKTTKKMSRANAPSRAQRLLQNGDIIYQTVRPYQMNNFFCNFEYDDNYVASTGYAQLRGYDSKEFLYQIIHTEDFVRRVIAKCTGSNYPAINSSDLANLHVAIPGYKEQQKISACLSSIDELITAEVRRLNALRAHRKGLLRQLFPAEGETLPHLRFPEFLDVAEWDIKPLGELAENLDNRRIPVTEGSRIRGQIPYYGASGIVDYINEFIFDEELLCVSEDGANLVTRTSPISFSISGKSWVNNHAHVLRFKSRGAQKIVEDYLNSISLEDFLTGMAQPKLNRAMLDAIPIPIPASQKEQREIADCLTSIDELIATESQKIDVLKAHKKGLTQQLFPVLYEVQ
jgi:type I restriction enzyme S subunit